MHTPHDLIIVGNGLAAATLALSLPASMRIALLCKHQLTHNASRHAQGGIAAVLTSHDSLEQHVADTLTAGAGHGHEPTVRAILAQGSAAIDWLLAQGVPFDRQADGDLHLTREGGHSTRRIVHTADRTGAAVMERLHQALAARPRLDILQHGMALDLLRDEHGHCCGVQVLHEGQTRPLLAPRVALATGGLGRIYPQTTTPPACTGDGIAMAWRAGCTLENLEFIQFHPTGLALDGTDRVFLISEAVRGEGGLLHNQAGKRFMPDHHPLAELAPRDIVARAIATEISRQQQPFVWLDISHQPADAILHHFPGIASHCLRHGIDITRDPIPVRPVQHYTCGGVQTDTAGRTSLPGLFCLGEAASTGLHGANRLASNALLECVVMGRNAARVILAEEPWPAVRSPQSQQASPHDSIPAGTDRHGTNDGSTAETDIPPFSRQALHALCAHSLGIVRNDHDLQRACRLLDAWQARLAPPPPADLHAHEDRNLLACARLVAHAAATQPANIGAHYNIDRVTAASPDAEQSTPERSAIDILAPSVAAI
ncbi:MAG: L-aspartate oxidase [Lautropia sp.]|nr:L-aspartate oxidase [Lautropia sp.]